MTRPVAGRRAAPWVAILGLCLLATGLAGCGGSQPEGPTTVLRVMMTEDWVTPPYIEAVREFERLHPGVRVDTDKGPIGDIPDIVRAGISSGAPPDVVQGHAHAGAGQGLAQQVDDLWVEHGLTPAEFLPGAVEDVTWGGGRYGLPLDTNAMVILYNVDHFRAAGVAPPDANTTFSDLERMAQALTAADGSRRGLAVPLSTWVSYGWIKANGGEVVEIAASGHPRFTFDDPRVVEAVTFLDRLIDAGWAFGPAGPDAASADAYALFRDGAASMHASGSWDLVKVEKDVPGGRFGAALMPRGLTGTTAGTVMGGSSLWVPVGSKQRDLAFEFMLLLTSDRYALRLAKEEGRLPVRPRVLADPHFERQDLRVFVEQLGNAHPPLLGALHEADLAFEQALSRVLRGGTDPTAALQGAQLEAVRSFGPS